MKRFCDENCNNCPLMQEGNAKMLTVIFNALYEQFGSEAYRTVEDHCPNLTCCFDCHIDDFCHVEGCELVAAAEEYCVAKNKTQQPQERHYSPENVGNYECPGD